MQRYVYYYKCDNMIAIIMIIKVYSVKKNEICMPILEI